jgi:cyanate permease
MRRAPEDHGLHPDGKSASDVMAGLTHKAVRDFSNSMTRGEAMRTPTFYYLVVAFGLISAGIQAMLLQTVPYVSDGGFSRTTGALMIVVASVPALITKPIWGYLIDRMEAPQPIAALSAMITGLATGLIVWAQATHSLSGLYAGFIGLGMGWGGLMPLQEVIWAGYFGRRYLGAVRSSALPLAMTIAAAGPLLTSFYFDQVGNYNGAIIALALINAVAALLLLLIPEPSAQRSPT